MKRMFLILVAIALSACSGMASAKPHQLLWTWPTSYCPDPGQPTGDPLAVEDLATSELIYSTEPIPMPSDTDGPCAPAGDPGPPASATVVPVSVPSTSITLNLQPGVTYYARIRVSAPTPDNWSSWSAQATFTVPYGRPNVIQLSDGGLLDRWTFVTVSTSRVNFFGGNHGS